MDKVEQLYNLYLEKKLITNATSLEKFRSAGADQQDALFNLGKKNNLFKETTFDTFKSAWTPSDVKKKDEPEQESTPQQEAPSKPSAKPSPPSGKEAKIKELTVKAAELAASGDQQGLAKIRQEIVALKKEAAPTPVYEKSGVEKPKTDWRAEGLKMMGREIEGLEQKSDVTSVDVNKPIEIKKQEAQAYNTEQKKKTEEEKKVREEMSAAINETYKRQAEYLGIKQEEGKEKLSTYEMRQMYEQSIDQAQKYLDVVPESRASLPINDVLATRKKINMMPSDTDEEVRAQLRALAENDKDLERAYQEMENRALEYWKVYDPGKYETYTDRMATIKDKVGDIPMYDFNWEEDSSKPRLSSEDKKFLEQFRIESLQLQQSADNYRAKKLTENYDFKSYSKDASSIQESLSSVMKQIKETESQYKLEENKIMSQHDKYNAQVRVLNDKVSIMEKTLGSYLDANGNIKDEGKLDEYNETYRKYQDLINEANSLQENRPSIYNDQGYIVAPATSPKVKQLYDQYNTLMEQYNKAGEKYGITPEVTGELNSAVSNLENSKASLAYAEKYQELSNDRAVAKYFQEEKLRVMKEGNAFEKGWLVARDIATGVGNTVLPILEAPKAISDMAGFEQEYGWADGLADWTQGFLSKVNEKTSYGDLEVPSWMTTVQDLSQGVGSSLGFAIGGGVAGVAGRAVGVTAKSIDAFQKSAVFTQVFLGGLNDNYQAAKLAGLSDAEAAAAATLQSGGQAIGELAVPDYKIFKAANRPNLFSAVKSLGLTQGVKNWAPTYTKNLAENFIKEGIEEGTSEIITKGSAKAINTLTDMKVYEDDIKSSDLRDVFTSGGAVGMIMEGFRLGHKYKHPVTNSATRWYAEMSEADREEMKMGMSIEDVNALNKAEKDSDAFKIAEDMKMIPQYAMMNEVEKDELFALLLEKKTVAERYRGIGLGGTEMEKQEIESLDAAIKEKFMAVDQRRETELQSEMARQREDIQEFGVSLRVPEVKTAEEVMSKGEFLDDNVAANADKGLSKMIDEVIEREDLTDDEKVQLAQVLEDRRQKINSYEYRSKNEVVTSTQTRPSGVVEKARAANERAAKPIAAAAAKENPVPVALDGVKGKVKVSDSTMVDNMGDTIPEGYYVFVPDSTEGKGARMGAVVIGSIEDIDSASTFEGVENNPAWSPENNMVANFTTPDGQTLSILDDDLSADVGVKQKEDVIGAAPQALFDVVFEEVTTELGIKEKPYLKDDTKDKEGLPSSQRTGQAPVQAGPVQGTGTEEVAPSGVVQEQEVDFDGAPELTPEEAELMSAGYDNAMSQVLELDDTLSPEDTDLAASFVQQGATPQEAVQMVRDEKDSISAASEPVVQEDQEFLTPLPDTDPVGRAFSLSLPFEYTRSRAMELKERAANDPTLKRALRNLDKAAESFAKTFGSKLPVYVFDTQQEMLDALAEVGEVSDMTNGSILMDDDGTILGVFMNAESQDFTVGSHEFVHGIMAEFFNDNPEMFNKWKDSILKNFKGSGIDRLNEWAESEYDRDSSAEEFITQLTAELADANKQLALPKSFLNSIKDLFNSIWEGVTGSPLFSERATEKDVITFINDMAKGLSTGQAMSTKAAEKLAGREKKAAAKKKAKNSKSVVQARASVNIGQINQINAADGLSKNPENKELADQIKQEIFDSNPTLEFIMNNFNKIEKALVNEGKLKVNCEL
jgi:hypothetical protein